MSYEKLKSHKTFGGETSFWKHESSVTKTPMQFSQFLPAGGSPVGCLIWLSGLTCTEENFITKAGAQSVLAEQNMMVVCPDTSPRGLTLPGEHDSYDFGSAAGFYLNATTEHYRDHYLMYDYLLQELIPWIGKEYGVEEKLAISGHSMGGHGALTIGLRNPAIFRSISAFSPIVNPVNAAWGKKAFRGYLGEDESTWLQYDACELLKQGKKHPAEILVDQGLADDFYPDQLRTETFVQTASEVDQKVNVRFQEGYDHSYYFISTFIRDHILFHKEHLV